MSNRTDTHPQQANDIIYLASPLQILSAIDYCQEHHVTPTVIVNFGEKKRQTNRAQMTQLLAKLPTNQQLEFKHIKNSVLRDLYTLLFMVKLKKLPRARRFLIGDFRSKVACNLFLANQSYERIYIDDGAATIATQLESIKPGTFAPILKSGRQRLFQRAFDWVSGLRYAELGCPDIYSIFNGDGFLRAEQRNLRAPTAPIQKALMENQCFFFGSKYSEAKLISLEDEIRLAQRIHAHYAEQNIEFCYIPHRDESPAKLAKLTELGITIKNLNAPAEVYFAEANEIPAHIAACWSTVLYSVGKAYELSSVTAFDVLDYVIKPEIKQRAQTVYDFYQQCGVERIKL